MRSCIPYGVNKLSPIRMLPSVRSNASRGYGKKREPRLETTWMNAESCARPGITASTSSPCCCFMYQPS